MTESTCNGSSDTAGSNDTTLAPRSGGQRRGTTRTKTTTTTTVGPAGIIPDYQRTDKDVPFGRGGPLNGLRQNNVLYQGLLQTHYKNYRASPSHMKTSFIKKNVIRAVHEQGGRFLQKVHISKTEDNSNHNSNDTLRLDGIRGDGKKQEQGGDNNYSNRHKMINNRIDLTTAMQMWKIITDTTVICAKIAQAFRDICKQSIQTKTTSTKPPSNNNSDDDNENDEDDTVAIAAVVSHVGNEKEHDDNDDDKLIMKVVMQDNSTNGCSEEEEEEENLSNNLSDEMMDVDDDFVVAAADTEEGKTENTGTNNSNEEERQQHSGGAELPESAVNEDAGGCSCNGAANAGNGSGDDGDGDGTCGSESCEEKDVFESYQQQASSTTATSFTTSWHQPASKKRSSTKSGSSSGAATAARTTNLTKKGQHHLFSRNANSTNVHDTIRRLRIQLDDNNRLYHVVTEENHELYDEYDKLKYLHETLLKEHGSLKRDYAALKNENDDLKHEISTTKNKIIKMPNDKEEIRELCNAAAASSLSCSKTTRAEDDEDAGYNGFCIPKKQVFNATATNDGNPQNASATGGGSVDDTTGCDVFVAMQVVTTADASNANDNGKADAVVTDGSSTVITIDEGRAGLFAGRE